MEIFRHLDNTPAEPDTLKNLLTLARLPELCASIDTSDPKTANDGELYCLWGTFDVRRDELARGVRFALLNCPHALAWTITCLPDGKAVVHCTLDKNFDDPDFLDSIDQFADDWAEGVARHLRAPA